LEQAVNSSENKNNSTVVNTTESIVVYDNKTLQNNTHKKSNSSLSTKIIDPKVNNSELKLKDAIKLTPANIYVDVDLKESNKSTPKFKNENKTVILPKSHTTRKLKELVLVKKESPKVETKAEAHIEDKVYEKIKNSNEGNEEFLQKQKELINSGKNMFMNDNNDFNIYKKIINISLSLIVVGLLMGILLGLILVMYLNSRSNK
jgi:hypothetical protein